MGVYVVEKHFTDNDFHNAFRLIPTDEQQNAINRGTIIDLVTEMMMKPYREWLAVHNASHRFRFESGKNGGIRCFFHIDDRDTALLFKMVVDDLA
jgi:hypothetical protein